MSHLPPISRSLAEHQLKLPTYSLLKLSIPLCVSTEWSGVDLRISPSKVVVDYVTFILTHFRGYQSELDEVEAGSIASVWSHALDI